MPLSNGSRTPSVETPGLQDRLKPRIAVEQYFASSRRTFRKGRLRVWFGRHVKPKLLELAFKTLGLYSRGAQNALQIAVRNVTLRFPDLPSEFDGFRILHISDLHIDEMDGLAEALSPVLRSLTADVCVMTGDYRFESIGSCEEVYPRMMRVFSNISTRHGIVGILGNHDAAEMALKFEDAGVRMLVNDAMEIRRSGASVWLIGLDDPFDYRRADLHQALSEVPAHSFKILLVHTPELYREAAAAGVQLYLCGHTHAGQVRLPIVGPLKKNARVPRAYVQGDWTFLDMRGYTSWGTGCSTLPIRLNCLPEVAVIELKRRK